MFYPVGETQKEKNFYTFSCSVLIKADKKRGEVLTTYERTDNMHNLVKRKNGDVFIVYSTSVDVKNSNYELTYRMSNMHVPRIKYECRTINGVKKVGVAVS